MRTVAKFSKISYQQFEKDWLDTFPYARKEDIKNIYEQIQIPKRATKGSAGYDFFLPIAICLNPKEVIKIPTGIRVEIAQGWVLQLFPRSSLGFKYRFQLNNTVGIIDSDYVYSDNEGHIFSKMMNDSVEEKVLELKQGAGFMQGIFLPFGICEDDHVETLRNGGFGSTDRKK